MPSVYHHIVIALSMHVPGGNCASTEGHQDGMAGGWAAAPGTRLYFCCHAIARHDGSQHLNNHSVNAVANQLAVHDRPAILCSKQILAPRTRLILRQNSVGRESLLHPKNCTQHSLSRGGPRIGGSMERSIWCPEPGSNRHAPYAGKRRILSPQCLPISPSGQCSALARWIDGDCRTAREGSMPPSRLRPGSLDWAPRIRAWAC